MSPTHPAAAEGVYKYLLGPSRVPRHDQHVSWLQGTKIDCMTALESISFDVNFKGQMDQIAIGFVSNQIDCNPLLQSIWV